MKTFRDIVIEGLNDVGTCYVDAYKYLNNNMSKNIKLVHGLVNGQGSLEGILYNHAWIEDGKNVIDPSQKPELTMKKDIYYKLGNIDEKNVFRYDFSAHLVKVMEYETYGPWERKLLSNRY